MTGGLKGFAEARKTPNELLREIQTHVVAEGNKNANVGRESHKIHVSELVKDTMCPRHLFYKLSEAEPTDNPQTAFHRLEMIWATGHDAHHKWQRWLREMGDLWGTWSCQVCGHRWDDLAPEVCAVCGRSLLKYEEVNLEDVQYRLVGHADGAVPRHHALVEVKSFAIGTVRIENPELVKTHTVKTVEGKSIVDIEAVWKAIKRPLRGHLKQGMFYLWMAKRMGLPYETIIFIYENKTTQATKTFEVKLSERLIKEEIAVLEDVVEHVQEGVAPARPSLFAPDSKPCKDCVFKTGCWEWEKSDEDPEGTAVPSRGSRARSEEAGRAAEVRTPGETEGADATGPRRRHRTRRPGTDRTDDAVDPVGRAPRRATRDGGGGREVGERRAGEGEGPRVTGERQGRDRAEGQSRFRPRGSRGRREVP